MKYNHERFLKLWKKKKNSKELKSRLTLEDLEFYTYEALVGEYISWTWKDNYFSLAEDFVSNKISLYDYMLQFQILLHKINKEVQTLLNDFEKLKNFNYNPASYGFNKVVGAFFEDWDLYDPTGPDEFDPDPDYPSDEEFRLSIKATFNKYYDNWKE
uniref:Uncharacterized protein n=1 Tax=Amicula sp. isolate GU52X-4 cfCalB7 TaxID=3003489 RepID=A0A9E8Z312_9STRA|nr:hypothetical protein [Amicula sp. isolate GU52X-4 cfCalB7]WAK84993.1 hypothetical protein [Amicula sp. isolate GU52X-4 cfCalB7]